MTISTAPALAPAELAKRWSVKPHHIGALIRNGSLRAFDVSLKPGGKPRWKINLSDVLDFELRRSVKPVVKSTRRKSRKQDSDFVQYF
jgi:hypothetical protein